MSPTRNPSGIIAAFVKLRISARPLGLAYCPTGNPIYIFGTADEGTPYTDSGFKKLWNVLMHSYVGSEGTESEKWFRAHDLRSLYVSEMLDQERDPERHSKKETMNKVYDRRPLIRVTPLA